MHQSGHVPCTNYPCCYNKRENTIFKGTGASSCRESIMPLPEELCGFIMSDCFCNENWMNCLKHTYLSQCLIFFKKLSHSEKSPERNKPEEFCEKSIPLTKSPSESHHAFQNLSPPACRKGPNTNANVLFENYETQHKMRMQNSKCFKCYKYTTLGR